MSFERISDDCIVWTSNGTEPSPTCPRCAELEAIGVNLQQQAALHFQDRQRLQARLAHVAAKSNRRHEALRELNNAMQIAHLMVANQTYQKQRLFEKLRSKPGVLKRIWSVLW